MASLPVFQSSHPNFISEQHVSINSHQGIMQSKVCLKVWKKGLSQTVYTDTRLFHYVSHLWQIIIMLLTEPVPDPREGQKGHMPPPPLPRKRPQGILCPWKKEVIIDLITPKASCEKLLSVRVAHSDLILTRLQSVKMVGH